MRRAERLVRHIPEVGRVAGELATPRGGFAIGCESSPPVIRGQPSWVQVTGWSAVSRPRTLLPLSGRAVMWVAYHSPCWVSTRRSLPSPSTETP